MPPVIAVPLAGQRLASGDSSIVVEEVADPGGGSDPPGAGSPEAIFAEHRSELLGWP